MKLIQHIENLPIRLTIFKVGFVLLLINSFMVNAQTVSKIQDLNFGNFISFGQGGTITVLPDYSYNKTGEIILKIVPVPAIFDLTNVEAGRQVQITYSNNNVTLHGDHSGSIALELTNETIVSGSSPTRITLGGKLTIGSSSVSPVGNYSGSFSVNFTVNNH